MLPTTNDSIMFYRQTLYNLRPKSYDIFFYIQICCLYFTYLHSIRNQNAYYYTLIAHLLLLVITMHLNAYVVWYSCSWQIQYKTINWVYTL